MADEPLQEWPDFEAYNATLVLTTLPAGGGRLVLMPNDSGTVAPSGSFFEAAKGLGFTLSESGYLLKKDIESIDLDAYRTAFPAVTVRPTPAGEIRQAAENLRPGFNAHLMHEQALTTNHEGNLVYQGDEGRFFYPEGRMVSTPVYETEHADPTLFLRAPRKEDIDVTLGPALLALLTDPDERHYFREDRLDELAAMLSPPPPGPAYSSADLRATCNAAASQALQVMLEADDVSPTARYAAAQDLQERFPAGFITPPLPLLILGQHPSLMDPDAGPDAGRLFVAGEDDTADTFVKDGVSEIKDDEILTLVVPGEDIWSYVGALDGCQVLTGVRCHEALGGYGLLRVQGRRPDHDWVLQDVNDWDSLCLAPAKPDQDKVVNPYQTPYTARAQGNVSDAMVPRRLQAPIMRALDRVEAEHGDITSFVARALQWTEEELHTRLGADQVDAVALAIHGDENGRGFILADQTGRGKGRVLAAMARYARLNGKPVVFLTEKDQLFSDFYRDLRNIGEHEHISPVMLNAESSIKDEDGNVVYRRTGAKAINQMLSQGALPENVNMLMATYSQVNRKRVDSNKPDFLVEACRGAYVLQDESHNCTGQSNTAHNISRCLGVAHNVIYSSATWAETGNMEIYANAFPKGVVQSGLREILREAGASMNEVLVNMLTDAGALCRREHDLSRVAFRTQQVRAEEHKAVIDQFAQVLTALTALRSQREDFLKQYADNPVFRELSQRLASEKTATSKAARQLSGARQAGDLGSGMQGLIDHFLLAIKMPVIINEALNDLRLGKKPVLMLNNTMEKVMSEALGGDGGHWPAGQTPDFRHILAWHLDKALTWRRQDTDVALDEHDPAMAEVRKEIEALIDTFPPLSISPLDTFRDAIEEAGHTVGELTGRTLRLYRNEDGSMDLINEKKVDRTDVVHDFNSGNSDVLAMSVAAGGTGISAHAGPDFRDQRQRVVIMPQLPYSSTRFLQALGRVNRREQVSVPEMKFLMTDTPGETRILSILSQKLATMSANLSGNQSSGILNERSLLNAYGNLATRKMLEANKMVANTLGVKLSIDNDKKPNWYVRRFLSGLMSFPLIEQQSLLDEVENEFDNIINQATERNGVSPLESKQFEWGARVTSRETVEQASQGLDPDKMNAFDAPVDLVELEYDEMVDTHDHHWIEAQVVQAKANTARIEEVRSHLTEQRDNFKAELAEKQERRARREAERQEKLGQKGGGGASGPPTMTEVRLDERITKLNKVLDFMATYQPGVQANWTSSYFTQLSNDGSLQGILRAVQRHKVTDRNQVLVLGLNVPKEWRQLQHYKLSMVNEEGQEKSVPLLALLDNDSFHMQTIAMHPSAIRNRWPEGKQMTHTKQVALLEGNLFSALDIAKQIDDGTPITYTMADGASRQGVLLPAKACQALRDENTRASVLPIKCGAEPELRALAHASHARRLIVNLYSESKQEGVMVHLPRNEGDDIRFSVPLARGLPQAQFAHIESTLAQAQHPARPRKRKLVRNGVTCHYHDYLLPNVEGINAAVNLMNHRGKLFVECQSPNAKNSRTLREVIGRAAEPPGQDTDAEGPAPLARVA